jgi:hypothetical protein
VDRELRDLTLELRDVTERLKNLTESTVDDSATVRVISIVSAVYLPGSFIGVSYLSPLQTIVLTSPDSIWDEFFRF